MFLKIYIYQLLRQETQVKIKNIIIFTFCSLLFIQNFTGTFNTTVDIKLKNWAEQQLPSKSVEAGWECLQQEFKNFMSQARKSPDHDMLFDNLKNSVVEEAITRHTWEDKVRSEELLI